MKQNTNTDAIKRKKLARDVTRIKRTLANILTRSETSIQKLQKEVTDLLLNSQMSACEEKRELFALVLDLHRLTTQIAARRAALSQKKSPFSSEKPPSKIGFL